MTYNSQQDIITQQHIIWDIIVILYIETDMTCNSLNII